MYKTQSTHQPTNSIIGLSDEQFDAIAPDVENEVLFKHFVDCLLEIANEQNNDLALFHLKKARENFNSTK